MMKKCKEKKKERKAEKEKEGVAGNEDNFVSVKMFRRKRSSFEKVLKGRDRGKEKLLSFNPFRNQQ